MGGNMARINIEDCWWTDPRRSKLIKLLGGENQADGAAVRMWRLAQEFWKDGRKLIPQYIFETLEESQALLGCGLASLGEAGVYVRGSSQYLDWVIEQREKSKKGGQKSAQRARDSKGRLLKTNVNDPTNIQAESNQDLTTSKQIQVSDSVSGSYSDSYNNTKKNISYSSSTEIKNFDSVVVEQVESKVIKLKNKPLSEIINFENETSLIAAIPNDCKERWAKIYPDQLFLNREVLKAFNWYSANKKRMPKNLRGWIQALSSWFDRAWPKHTKSIQAVQPGFSENQISEILAGRA